MNRITANLLTDIFNRSSDTRRINSKEIYISMDTEGGGEMVLRPFTPQAAADYLTHFISDNKHSLFDPMELTSDMVAPINVVFNGMYYDKSVRKEYNVPLITFRHCPRRKESVLIFDRFFQEENPEMLKYIKAPSVHQLINTLSAAGTTWADVEFNAQNDKSRPSLRLVK